MTNFLKKLNKIDKELDNNLVHHQVLEVNRIVKSVEEEEVLKQSPNKLGLTDFEIANLRKGNSEKTYEINVLNNMLNSLRQYLSLNYGIWSLPNLETAKLIKNELQIGSALEIMAGNAFWSKALSEVGIRTVSTDSLEWAKTSSTGKKPFYPVKDYSATSAIKIYKNVDLILCSWSPNFGTADLEVVKAWKKYNPKSHLLFIGEEMGATNSSEFWLTEHFTKSTAINKINKSFVSYDFINEKIYEIENEL